MKYLTLFLLLVVFNSCVKTVNTISGLPDPKPSIYCFLTDIDTVTKVFLHRPMPIGFTGYQNYLDDPIIEDAVVSILVDSNTYYLAYNSSFRYYSISKNNLVLIKGKTYFLNVKTIDGIKYTSQCTIPNMLCPAYQLISSRDSSNNSNFDYTCSFIDNDQSIKYYLLQTYFPTINNSDTNFNILESYPIKKDVFQKQINFSRHIKISQQQSDELSLGISLPGSGVTSNLFLIDENVYKYYLTKNENSSTGLNTNPTPVPVFSNIANGVGVMGSLFVK